MRVACARCGTMIRQAQMRPSDDVPGRTVLDVFCHGEKDSMNFDQEWIDSNRDFMTIIMNDMTTGLAFGDPTKEYEKIDAQVKE